MVELYDEGRMVDIQDWERLLLRAKKERCTLLRVTAGGRVQLGYRTDAGTFVIADLDEDADERVPLFYDIGQYFAAAEARGTLSHDDAVRLRRANLLPPKRLKGGSRLEDLPWA